MENEILEENNTEQININTEKTNVNTEKKEEKGKKAKKEKPKKKKTNKEKKKGSKKPLIFIILILIVAGALVLGYKFLPTIMKGVSKNYEVNILVDYKKNLLFNKYDMSVTFNGTNIGTVTQGESITHSEELPNGTYVITFTSTEDPTNTTSSIIEISDSTKNIGYKVTADWKGLSYKEDSNPTIILEANSEEITDTETVVTEENIEESTEEEIKEEKTEE